MGMADHASRAIGRPRSLERDMSRPTLVFVSPHPAGSTGLPNRPARFLAAFIDARAFDEVIVINRLRPTASSASPAGDGRPPGEGSQERFGGCPAVRSSSSIPGRSVDSSGDLSKASSRHTPVGPAPRSSPGSPIRSPFRRSWGPAKRDSPGGSWSTPTTRGTARRSCVADAACEPCRMGTQPQPRAPTSSSPIRWRCGTASLSLAPVTPATCQTPVRHSIIDRHRPAVGESDLSMWVASMNGSTPSSPSPWQMPSQAHF